MPNSFDIRDEIFRTVSDKLYEAKLIAEGNGIISGTEFAMNRLNTLNIEVLYIAKEGTKIRKGEMIAKIRSTPKLLTVAENFLIGKFAKTSGIATAAYKASELSNKKIKIVCGSLKKAQEESMASFRKAIETGGISSRICDSPFIYLDKNYIKIFGGIPQTLKAVKNLKEYKKVIQIHNTIDDIEEEVRQAVSYDADILMIDTGKDVDIDKCFSTLKKMNAADKTVAFSGNVKLDRIKFYIDKSVDILCIGKEIIDAKLLDLKFDILL